MTTTTRLLLLDHDGDDAHTSSYSLEFITLLHPGTNAPTQFALSTSISPKPATRLLEVTKANDPDVPRSWFVGNSVQSDGALFLLTKIDPLFVVLPLLDAARGKFYVADQLLREKGGNAEWLRIGKCEGMTYRLICDVDDVDPDMTLVRLNEDSTIRWLKEKVEKLARHFYSTTPAMDFGGKVEGFVMTMVNNNVVDDVSSCMTVTSSSTTMDGGPREREAKRRAMQVVCDYLPERWREIMVKSMEGGVMTLKSVLASTFMKAAANSANKNGGDDDENSLATAAAINKPKTWEEENGYTNASAQMEHLRYTRPSLVHAGRDESTAKKMKTGAAPPTSAHKQLAKVNKTGIPSITSFFKKKEEG